MSIATRRRDLHDVRPVGVGFGERYRPLVDTLPLPVALVEPRDEDWTVLLVNDAFRQLVAPWSVADGLPLAKALSVPVVAAADGASVRAPLDDLLTRAAQSGEPASGDVVLPDTTSWSVQVRPLAEPGDVPRALVVTFMPAGGTAIPGGVAALHDLARGLSADKPPEQIYADVLSAAVTTAGAGRGVILVSDAGSLFNTVASTPGAGVQGPLTVEDRTSPLWQTAFGRRRLRWHAADVDRPLPFAEGLAVGIALGGRRTAVLAVGEPHAGEFDDATLDRLALVAELGSTGLYNARLVDSLARLERFLRGAVQTSAALVEATEPTAVRRRLLERLVAEAGLPGAALWAPREEDGLLELTDAAGLPQPIRDEVSLLEPDSVAARLLDTGGASAAPSSWPGHFLRLVSVPEPAVGVLGVYAEQPLPELADGVLATLAHALASAVQQTTLHKRARMVVNSLVRELRPTAVTLPEGLSVGTVYRSATAGVDVGGDFFDVFRARDGRIGVACGDVSGKGVEAASLTAMAVYSLRAYALANANPEVLLTRLNHAVCRQTTDERFMTIAYLRLDPAPWTAQLTLAGHPPPLLVGPDGVRVLEVPPDMPVGIDEDASFHRTTVPIPPGTSIVLYTDGVTEARRGGAPDGALLGIEGLLHAVRKWAPAHGRGAQELADAVDEAVTTWTSGGISDDTAIVVVTREAQPDGLTLVTTPISTPISIG